jgi:hypothetical protein
MTALAEASFGFELGPLALSTGLAGGIIDTRDTASRPGRRLEAFAPRPPQDTEALSPLGEFHLGASLFPAQPASVDLRLALEVSPYFGASPIEPRHALNAVLIAGLGVRVGAL